MPSVFTISGSRSRRLQEAERCKWVRNGKSGCKIKLCFVGKSKKHPTGWSFIKGSQVCGTRRQRKKKRSKRRKR